MKNILFWLIASFIVVTSCQRSEQPVWVEESNAESLKLDTFSRIPVVYSYAGCVFSVSEEAFANRYYLMVTGRDEAMIKINGEEIRVQLVEEIQGTNSLRKRYEGNGFIIKLMLDLSNSTEPNVGDFLQGDLEVQCKRKSTTYKVVVFCG